MLMVKRPACGIRCTPVTGHKVNFLVILMREIKVRPESCVLGCFSHLSKFDNHEGTPSVDVIEILLAGRGSLVNVRVNIGSCQPCVYKKVVLARPGLQGQAKEWSPFHMRDADYRSEAGR
jgi:hypothetical protein